LSPFSSKEKVLQPKKNALENKFFGDETPFVSIFCEKYEIGNVIM